MSFRFIISRAEEEERQPDMGNRSSRYNIIRYVSTRAKKGHDKGFASQDEFIAWLEECPECSFPLPAPEGSAQPSAKVPRVFSAHR